MRGTIIFDLDGTLVDSCGVCVDILQQMIDARGVAHVIDPVHARGFMSRGGEMMVASLLGPAAVDPAGDLKEFRGIYANTKTRADALFEGVGAGLRALEDCGYELAICSNKPQSLCDQVLQDTAIARHFKVVVGGQSAFRPKPAPDLLDHTMNLLGVSADACIYVGDSELDHQTAAARSVPFHFLTYGYADPEWVPESCQVHDHFAELTEALLRRAPQLVQ